MSDQERRLEASPTKRAMTMAGNRMPRVDKKVASILAEVLTDIDVSETYGSQ